MRTKLMIGIAILFILLGVGLASAVEQKNEPSLGEKAGDIAGGVVSGTITGFFSALRTTFNGIVQDPTIKGYETSIKNAFDSEFRRTQSLNGALKRTDELLKEATDLLSNANSAVAYSKGKTKYEDPKDEAKAIWDEVFK